MLPLLAILASLSAEVPQIGPPSLQSTAIASIKTGHHDCPHCDLASFRNADLAGANLAHAKVDNADFSGADLSIASIKGTDLLRARGLTQAQVDRPALILTPGFPPA